eukprot:6749373-Alexandrium_andersonii.AAC.1
MHSGGTAGGAWPLDLSDAVPSCGNDTVLYTEPAQVLEADPFDLDWELQAALDDWLIVERAGNGRPTGAYAQHENATARSLQFAHQIKDGLDEFFICRVPSCAFVGRNTDWAHTLRAGGYKFACP